MYKFPVIKNNVKYGVSVNEHYLLSDTYETKLYKKTKVLWFYINRKLLERNYSYDYEDDRYLNYLKNNTLYQHLAKVIIEEYEEIHCKGLCINENIEAYKEWDGIIK